jgi:hypothetical protein
MAGYAFVATIVVLVGAAMAFVGVRMVWGYAVGLLLGGMFQAVVFLSTHQLIKRKARSWSAMIGYVGAGVLGVALSNLFLNRRWPRVDRRHLLRWQACRFAGMGRSGQS